MLTSIHSTSLHSYRSAPLGHVLMAPFTHSSAHTSLPSIHTDSSLLVVGSHSLHTLTFLSALMRRGCTLMLSLAAGTVVLGVMVAALLGEVEMMA